MKRGEEFEMRTFQVSQAFLDVFLFTQAASLVETRPSREP